MTRTSASLAPGSGTGISSMRKSVSAGSPGGRRARTTRRQVFGVIEVSPVGWAPIVGPNTGITGQAGRGPPCGEGRGAGAARRLAAGRGGIFFAGTPAELRSGTRRLALSRFGNRALGASPRRWLLALLPPGFCNFRLWRRGRSADFTLDLTRIAQPGLEIARRRLGEFDARRLDLAILRGFGDKLIERILRRVGGAAIHGAVVAAALLQQVLHLTHECGALLRIERG